MAPDSRLGLARSPLSSRRRGEPAIVAPKSAAASLRGSRRASEALRPLRGGPDHVRRPHAPLTPRSCPPRPPLGGPALANFAGLGASHRRHARELRNVRQLDPGVRERDVEDGPGLEDGRIVEAADLDAGERRDRGLPEERRPAIRAERVANGLAAVADDLVEARLPLGDAEARVRDADQRVLPGARHVLAIATAADAAEQRGLRALVPDRAAFASAGDRCRYRHEILLLWIGRRYHPVRLQRRRPPRRASIPLAARRLGLEAARAVRQVLRPAAVL